MSALTAPPQSDALCLSRQSMQSQATAPVEVHAPQNLGIDDLRELMRSVNQASQNLQDTHFALHNQVTRLQGELAEANAALRRSQALAALGEMAAGIAHEVRNPLGSIQLYAQMLAEDLADRPAQAALCAKIDRAVIGLDAIVRDVLTFARDMTVRPEMIGAKEVFDRALESCESLLTSDIQIHREDDTDHKLFADPRLITQALGNLIRNALEALREGDGAPPRRPMHLQLSAQCRRVRCPIGKSEFRIILGVQDNGPGIPAEMIDRIFNPFFTTRKTGTGLGLAIVHRIIDAHAGHINIENIPLPAGGAKFELCLPTPPTNVDCRHLGMSTFPIGASKHEQDSGC